MLDELIAATRGMKIVTLLYTKASTGEMVTHTGGIQELGYNKAGSEVVWLWDTDLQDHIRQFLISNINSVTTTSMDYQKNNSYPIKIFDEIVQP